MSIQFGQQRGGRIRRDAMLPATDQIEGIGIHDLQRAGLERRGVAARLADLFETAEMNQAGHRALGLSTKPRSWLH